MTSDVSPLRVLVVEDSNADAKLITHELAKTGRPIEWRRVERADQMRAALTEQAWDVVVADWTMPSFSGPAAMALLAELELDLPFLIVSGTVGEAAAVEAMRAGAHDYVLKDSLARLCPAVERELRECEARRERRRAEDRLRASEARYQRMVETTHQGLLERVRLAAVSAEAGLALARGGPLAEVLQSCADAVVTHLDALSARIWTVTARSEAPELQGAAGVVEPEDGAAAAADEVARTRRPFVGADVAGYPLVVDDQAVGVLWVRSRGPMSDAARRGLASLVDTIAVGIQRKRAEEMGQSLEAQLRQAQKMEAVGQLAGGIAHDFNNVLSVIVSYSEMILADLRDGDPLREEVSEILAAGLRAGQLTRQLLLFSRQQVVEPKVLDLNVVVAGMERMLQRLVGEDVELTAVLGAALGRVMVDAGSIEQVIMNLAVNARDAMPRGGKLTVETANVELDESFAGAHHGVSPGPHVLLAVSDTGIGMDRKTMGRLFEPFFTTKERGKGTGLGLSTVFGIARQSGGTVWAYSEVGVGTTFKVYLPRVDAPPAEAPSAAIASRMEGTETILLVEDEDQVRDVVRAILRRHGYTVLDTRSAGEALLLGERHPGTIDLLLTDLVMPQLNGTELAARLVRHRPGLKVLYMSGYTDDAVVRHGVLGGALAYLQKPISVDALSRKVREVLGPTSTRAR